MYNFVHILVYSSFLLYCTLQLRKDNSAEWGSFFNLKTGMLRIASQCVNVFFIRRQCEVLVYRL
jgi:hypothetical protein